MIVVEVLGRGGRVAERVRLQALPATIGRAYGNDVVLDDPYADATHARLGFDAQGRVVVEDLGSVNGLVAGEQGPRAGRLVLAPGAVFRVGHTLLRVASGDAAPAPAVKDSGGAGWTRAFRRPWVAGALTLAGAPLFGLAFYLGQTDKTGGAPYALDVLTSAAAVVLWAGVWALGTRIRGGRASFAAHLAVAWLVLGFALAVVVGEDWLRFFTSGTWVADAAAVAAVVAIVMVVVDSHLQVASSLSARARALIGAGITVALLGVAALAVSGTFADNQDDIVIDMPLKPVPARFVPTETPDAFLARAAKLQREVDQEADEQ